MGVAEELSPEEVRAPADHDPAALGAATEHFAFGPDHVWRLSGERLLEAYADLLVGKPARTFWRD